MACNKNKEGLKFYQDSNNGKCRLNCEIPVAVATRLEEISDTTGMTKVGVVIAALQAYFNMHDVQEQMRRQMFENPEYMGRLIAGFKDVAMPNTEVSFEGLEP